MYYQAFTAANVNLITKTRTEHLSEQDKERTKNTASRSPLEMFLGAAEEHQKHVPEAAEADKVSISIYFILLQ